MYFERVGCKRSGLSSFTAQILHDYDDMQKQTSISTNYFPGNTHRSSRYLTDAFGSLFVGQAVDFAILECWLSGVAVS